MPIFNSILEKRSLQPPLLYGISDRHSFPRLASLRYLELLFLTEVHVIQWREKDLSTQQQKPLIQRGRQLAALHQKLFLVNTHTREALTEGADGVHLTSGQSLPEALQLRATHNAGEGFLIGKSVHSLAEALRAEQEGADYVMLGPIFDPISKESPIRPLGLSGLREAAQMLYVALVAVGGIDKENLRDVFSTNAVGAAGISWLARAVRKQMEHPAG